MVNNILKKIVDILGSGNEISPDGIRVHVQMK